MPETKKRHVETVTRLPTKRMATACWAFIVAKSTLLETAPVLHFPSLPVANRKRCAQFMHKAVDDLGANRTAARLPRCRRIKLPAFASILYGHRNNPGRRRQNVCIH
jgi:hypothetical protein